MAFGNSTQRQSKKDFVLAVGWRAYINSAVGTGDHSVPMVDGAGVPIGNDLADGQEVEILSWRPRSREGLAYQVRRVSDGSEWWIASTYLRRGAVRPAVAADAPGNGSAAKQEKR